MLEDQRSLLPRLKHNKSVSIADVYTPKESGRQQSLGFILSDFSMAVGERDERYVMAAEWTDLYS